MGQNIFQWKNVTFTKRDRIITVGKITILGLTPNTIHKLGIQKVEKNSREYIFLLLFSILHSLLTMTLSHLLGWRNFSSTSSASACAMPPVTPQKSGCACITASCLSIHHIPPIWWMEFLITLLFLLSLCSSTIDAILIVVGK
jgi:hypothetical protein